MSRFAFLSTCALLCAWAATARAQVVPSATREHHISITAGGLASAFQPNYAGGLVASSSSDPLFGMGAYVDVKLTRWFQAEAEGRWLRFNSFISITEDNYLLGPRVPIHRFHWMGATPYGKVLFGMGKMTFEYNDAYGHFTDIAYGGGLDLKLNKRWTLRAADFEYQQWPNWVNGSLHPYGASAGIGYRIF
jgi:opacity protein-like surface antigen